MPFPSEIYMLIAVAIGWGFMEQHVYSHGYKDTTYHLFGKLSLRYHIVMWAIWIFINTAAGYWWFTPMFAMIEDLSYFVFDPSDELDKDDWINMGLGGIPVLGFWVPTMYIIAIVLTALLYYINL